MGVGRWGVEGKEVGGWWGWRFFEVNKNTKNPISCFSNLLIPNSRFSVIYETGLVLFRHTSFLNVPMAKTRTIRMASADYAFSDVFK